MTEATIAMSRTSAMTDALTAARSVHDCLDGPRSSFIVARLRPGDDAGEIRIFAIGDGRAAPLTVGCAIGPALRLLLLLLALGLLAVALVDGRSLRRR